MSDMFGLYAQFFTEASQRASLLRTQARHARLTARYIRMTGESNRLHVVEEITLDREASLLQLLREIHQNAEDLLGGADEGLSTWSKVVGYRIRYNDVITKALTHLRQVERLVTQGASGLPVDVKPPAIYHGIKQNDFLLTTSDTSQHYYRSLAGYANRRVLSGQPLKSVDRDVLIAHNHLPFPRHRSYVSGSSVTSTVSPDRITIARIPIWYGYLSRLHPNIAHEMAHPVVAAAVESTAESARGFQECRAQFAKAIADLIQMGIGPGRVLGFSNLEQIILDECHCDILSLRIAGPACLASMAVSIAGLRELSNTQALEPPLSVRLAVLIRLMRRWYPMERFPLWYDFADSLEQYLAHYYAWLRAHEGDSKASYQECLTGLVEDYADKVIDLWDLNAPLEDGAATDDLVDAFTAYVDGQLRLPEFEGVHSTTKTRDFVETIRSLSPLAVGPNMIWLLYIANSGLLRRSPGHLPEGRIFHEWNRLVTDGARIKACEDTERVASLTAVKFEFGTFWEFLFFSVLWPSARHSNQPNVPRPDLQEFVRSVTRSSDFPTLASNETLDGQFSVVGGFDILTMRKGYQAKVVISDWPQLRE